MRLAFLALAGAVALAGAASAQTPEAACAALAGRAIAAEDIGLPTGGATVATATFTAPAGPSRDATGFPVSAQPAHCRLLGSIAPVDPQAPPIRFQLNLPIAAEWNGKALQYGGGGFNGVLITGLAPLRDSLPGAPTPLTQGYATYGTDSGHQNEALPEIQAFALNDEALTNFAYASYKKVRDVAMLLVAAHYGRAPARTYFFGGSEGGREGLVVAQRFPQDYDGVVSAVPVINWVGLMLAFVERGGVAQADGGWLDAQRVAVLRRGVIAACDGMDGLADGVVSDVEGCARRFGPDAPRCPDGREGAECLSDRQLAAVRSVRSAFRLPFAQINGLDAYPPYLYGGEDQPDGMVAWTFGPEAPRFPMPAPERQSRLWWYGNGMVRYFVARDPAFDPLRFDASRFAARLAELSRLMDTTNPDLSAFAARGGRLILKENLADYAQSPMAGIEYFRSVVARLGQDNVDRFMRLYTVPGANHGGRVFSGLDGAAMPSHVDLLALLDAWAERGTAPPDAPTLTGHAAEAPFAATASRPMCRWPAWPRHDGTGDPRRAESFACITR
ncbi:tannase/feruloyl esterase family alpha/beta hydrolase [Falsiroseomonas sp. HW251]|uniref:tannase/feruloyl esterase family alpha/beta hydrolase n=1 Tax=Falsiroseomonas sp. HW251 TaxID=3390998 RepID=UPI003D31A10B